jgi:hypothetical protein
MTLPDEPRFCTYCAAPLAAGAPFCAHCGRQVPLHLAHTAGESEPAPETCRFCGAPADPVDRFCPVCGHEAWRAPGAAGAEAGATLAARRGWLGRIVVIAVVIALVSGASLGVLAPGLFGATSSPSPSESPGIAVVITPPPILTPEPTTPEPTPSEPPATPPETFPPIASPTFDVASPSFALPSESPAFASPSFALPSGSPLLESPSPALPRTVVVGITKTDPPAKGNFQVTLQQIVVLPDDTMQFYFHVKNVSRQNDCVKLNSDGIDDFLVDFSTARYAPAGWATASGPLPLDKCGPVLRPGQEWDYYDVFPALNDPSQPFDLTIYHGDLVFSGLSVAP